jgi:CheY-like chemotaxis protein
VSKVVFCEDDPMIRKLVQTALRSTTHDVHVADNGKAGLALIEQIRPDVVFSDVAMPEMDGFELADAMRARPDLAHIPIVFMTASVQREQIEECFRHGAAGHLAKPFTMAELRTRVAQFSKS